MEETYHRTYLATEDISKILQGCGNSISKGGHVYYLGKESAGILGFVDASEMPDTYGAAFTEFRGFCTGGWVGAGAVEGDISDRGFLYRISIQQFVDDIRLQDIECFTQRQARRRPNLQRHRSRVVDMANLCRTRRHFHICE